MFFRDLLRLELALALDGELTRSSVEQAFDRLYALCEDPTMRRKVDAYGRAEVSRMKLEVAELKGKRATRTVLTDSVRTLIFGELCAAAAWRYQGRPPKVHHWTPASHLKRFSRKGEGHTTFPTVVWSEKALKGRTVQENFAHCRSNGGFYALPMEYFFSRIEGAVGLVHTTTALTAVPLYHLVAHAALMVTEEVRKPAADGSFQRLSFGAHAALLAAVLEATPELYGRVVASSRLLALAPAAETRWMNAGAEKALSFPLGSKHALVLSTAPLPLEQAHSLMQRHQKNMIARARRRKHVIVGLFVSDLKREVC